MQSHQRTTNTIPPVQVYGTADLLPDQILGDVMRSYVDVKLTVKPRAD